MTRQLLTGVSVGPYSTSGFVIYLNGNEAGETFNTLCKAFGFDFACVSPPVYYSLSTHFEAELHALLVRYGAAQMTPAQVDELTLAERDLTRLVPDWKEHPEPENWEDWGDWEELLAPSTSAHFVYGLSYHEYMQSDRWRELRRIAIDRDGGRCRVCNGDQQLEVHHRRYPKNFAEDCLDNLTTLCAWCHRGFHKARKRAIANGRWL